MQGVLIRIGALFPGRVTWAKIGREGEVSVRTGTLAEAARFCEHQRVTVLVPGQDVLLAAIEIPGSNRKQLKQAAPFALEEQLAEDIENIHVVVGAKDGNGQHSVAAVSKKKMIFWLRELQEVGITPHAMLPEILALAHEPGSWSVCIENDVALVRTGEQKGFAVDTANLATLLAVERKGLDAIEDIPVVLYGQSGSGRDFVMPQGLVLQKNDQDGVVVEHNHIRFFGAGEFSGKTVDLLQGEYQRHAEWIKVWKFWQAPAILAIAAIFLYGGLLGSDYLQLRRRSMDLDREMVKIYRETFPGGRNGSQPRIQMEQKLNELRGTGQTRGDFLAILAAVGEDLVVTKGYVLKSLRFKSGVLDIDLQLQDLESLDDLKTRLAGRKGIGVEIKSASAKGGSVKARLLVQEKGE